MLVFWQALSPNFKLDGTGIRINFSEIHLALLLFPGWNVGRQGSHAGHGWVSGIHIWICARETCYSRCAMYLTLHMCPSFRTRELARLVRTTFPTGCSIRAA